MADDSEDLEANSVVSEASAESEDNRSFTTYSGRHETQRTSVLLAAVPEDLFDPAQLPEMSFTCDYTSFSGGDGACGYGDGGYGGGDGACGYGDGGYGGGDGASSSSSDETDGGTRNKRNSVAATQIRAGIFHLDTAEKTLFSLPWESISEQPERSQHLRDQGIQVTVDERRVIRALKQKIEVLKQQVVAQGAKVTLASKAEDGFMWMTSSDTKFYFYTGLSRAAFDVLLTFLGPDADSLQMWGPKRVKMNPRFQLAMTLMRLRQVSTHIDLSYRFKISRETIGHVFISWIQFMFLQFSELKEKMFAPRSFHKPLPKSFQNPLLRDVRIVIDCTEFYIESSSDFKQQGNLYSSYKSRSTAKVLIGVSPCGAAMFISEVYEGAISDREIVKKSGFLNYLKAGDVVMADRGFTIEDLLAEKGAKLLIPPFLGARKEFTNQEIVLMKLIAKARIHVERYNERIKNCRILSGVLPHHLVPLISQIVFVLCCIVNFQEPLAK
jgi:hypothetical protein